MSESLSSNGESKDEDNSAQNPSRKFRIRIPRVAVITLAQVPKDEEDPMKVYASIEEVMALDLDGPEMKRIKKEQLDELNKENKLAEDMLRKMAKKHGMRHGAHMRA